jgi:hypothetical protein
MKNIVECTATGEEHGLINVLPNYVEATDYKHMAPHIKAKVEKEKKEDSEIKEVEYINRTGKQERLEMVYCKYAGDPIQKWKFIPGRTYKVPMGLVKQVNQVKIPQRQGLLEVDGEKVNKDGTPLDRDRDGNWIHKMIPVAF